MMFESLPEENDSLESVSNTPESVVDAAEESADLEAKLPSEGEVVASEEVPEFDPEKVDVERLRGAIDRALEGGRYVEHREEK